MLYIVIENKMQEYIQNQIKVLEKHDIIYQSIKLDVYETDKKIEKKLTTPPTKYTNTKLMIREFDPQYYNCVCVPLGKLYDGLILIDVDIDDNKKNHKRI